ncbi:MAG: hypothetical protein GY953_09900, partial [bacterium]|nr:hypothetical protein [bacterium]
MTLAERDTGTLHLALRLSLPEKVLQSLTLSFVPATKADQAVVTAFGGIENAPAAVVNLAPEFRLDGVVIATGKAPLPTAKPLELTITHLSPTPIRQNTC